MLILDAQRLIFFTLSLLCQMLSIWDLLPNYVLKLDPSIQLVSMT